MSKASPVRFAMKLTARCSQIAAQFGTNLASFPRLATRALVNLALPATCAGCDQPIEFPEGSISLCQQCLRVFESAEPSICHRCASPAPAVSIRPTGCVHCADTSFRFHRIAALGVYRTELQSFVLRMKHLSGESLAIAAGQLLARRIREANWDPWPELVTVAPMHWARRLRRGVNAAETIGEAVARELKLPLAIDLLRVVRVTPRQSSLTPSRRRHNMRKAFEVSRAYDVSGAHILVIDDVFTSWA